MDPGSYYGHKALSLNEASDVGLMQTQFKSTMPVLKSTADIPGQAKIARTWP